MAIYKKFLKDDGSTRYLVRNGDRQKFIAQKDIPANVVELLKAQDEVDDKDVEASDKYRGCIFCGAHSAFTRTVNFQTVDLCENDYYDKNIGKIAQRINEVNNEKAKATR